MKHEMTPVEMEIATASGHLGIAAAMLREALYHSLAIDSKEDIKTFTNHIHQIEQILRPVIHSNRKGLYEYLAEIRNAGSKYEIPNGGSND